MPAIAGSSLESIGGRSARPTAPSCVRAAPVEVDRDETGEGRQRGQHDGAEAPLPRLHGGVEHAPPLFAQPVATTCIPDVFEVHATELNQFGCRLQKNRKYWIAIAPEQDFAECGQTAWMLSQLNTDHPAQQIFLGLVPPLTPWGPIDGNAGGLDGMGMPIPGCEMAPPAGTRTDLAFQIFAAKSEKACPEDVNQDGAINVLDIIDVSIRS